MILVLSYSEICKMCVVSPVITLHKFVLRFSCKAPAKAKVIVKIDY